MHKKTWFFLILWLAVPLAALAAPGATAKSEINGLMDALAKSGCQFERNGDWYDAGEARSHLQRKYDYLLKKNQVDTAEQFIQLAASKSSTSGKAYRVKCGPLTVDSAVWFDMQLQTLRKPAAARP